MEKKYRPGILAVFINENREVLLFERADKKGAWQFPQGGVEKGEWPEQALEREMLEEIGTKSFRVLLKAKETTKYDWPDQSRRYSGQEHEWFLCEFRDGAQPDLLSGDHSFQSFKWEKATEVCSQMIDWKRESTEKGLKLLGLIP